MNFVRFFVNISFLWQWILFYLPTQKTPYSYKKHMKISLENDKHRCKELKWSFWIYICQPIASLAFMDHYLHTTQYLLCIHKFHVSWTHCAPLWIVYQNSCQIPRMNPSTNSILFFALQSALLPRRTYPLSGRPWIVPFLTKVWPLKTFCYPN